MARSFGQNDIQNLLQHLNKYSKGSSSKEESNKRVPKEFNVIKSHSEQEKSETPRKSIKRSKDEFVAVQLSKADRKKLKKQKLEQQKKEEEEEEQQQQPEVEEEEEEESEEEEEEIQKTNQEAKQTNDANSSNRNERSQKLRSSCLDRLMEAQFRNINEYLYSNTSLMALNYMNSELFDKYHQAYRKIVDRWPVKPCDVIIKKIVQSKPKSKKAFVIADMGCGDAQIAQHFANSKDEKWANVKVHSFDLVSNNEFVTQASMHNVPLAENSCDVVVFCLSLMGINVKDCLLEANRIMKKDGTLLILEVSSRFEEIAPIKFTQILESFEFSTSKHQFLPPNDFFVFFQGRKRDNVTKLKGLPFVTLKACRYKIR